MDKKIPTMFDPQKIGESLREVDVSVIQTEHEKVLSRWFHGPHDADVFIWTDEKNNVIKQQVTFCGQVVEWNLLDGLRTGVIIEEEFESPGVGASEVIRFDQKPQNSAIRLALDLLHHIQTLDAKTRNELIQQLREAPSFLTMKAEEIVHRYGSNKTSTPDNIWQKFLDVFRKAFKS